MRTTTNQQALGGGGLKGGINSSMFLGGLHGTHKDVVIHRTANCTIFNDHNEQAVRKMQREKVTYFQL